MSEPIKPETLIAWDEPRSGLSDENKEITAHVKLVATAGDCAAICRYNHPELSYEQALDEFMVVNWAYKYVPAVDSTALPDT